MQVIDEVMADFAMKYGQLDLHEAVMGGIDIDVDIKDFDISNSTHAILMGLDAMMATPSAENRVVD